MERRRGERGGEGREEEEGENEGYREENEGRGRENFAAVFKTTLSFSSGHGLCLTSLVCQWPDDNP